MAVSRWNLASGPLPKADSKAHSARIGSTVPGVPAVRGAYSKGSLVPRGYEAERQVCAAIDRVGHSCRDESMRSRITANDAKRTVPHVQLTRSSSRG